MFMEVNFKKRKVVIMEKNYIEKDSEEKDYKELYLELKNNIIE